MAQVIKYQEGGNVSNKPVILKIDNKDVRYDDLEKIIWENFDTYAENLKWNNKLKNGVRLFLDSYALPKLKTGELTYGHNILKGVELKYENKDGSISTKTIFKIPIEDDPKNIAAVSVQYLNDIMTHLMPNYKAPELKNIGSSLSADIHKKILNNNYGGNAKAMAEGWEKLTPEDRFNIFKLAVSDLSYDSSLYKDVDLFETKRNNLLSLLEKGFDPTVGITKEIEQLYTSMGGYGLSSLINGNSTSSTTDTEATPALPATEQDIRNRIREEGILKGIMADYLDDYVETLLLALKDLLKQYREYNETRSQLELLSNAVLLFESWGNSIKGAWYGKYNNARYDYDVSVLDNVEKYKPLDELKDPNTYYKRLDQLRDGLMLGKQPFPNYDYISLLNFLANYNGGSLLQGNGLYKTIIGSENWNDLTVIGWNPQVGTMRIMSMADFPEVYGQKLTARFIKLYNLQNGVNLPSDFYQQYQQLQYRLNQQQTLQVAQNKQGGILKYAKGDALWKLAHPNEPEDTEEIVAEIEDDEEPERPEITRKNNRKLELKDYQISQLVGLGGDIAMTIGSFTGGAVNPLTTAGVIGSIGGYAYSDFADPNVPITQAIGNIFGNAALAGLNYIPFIGGALNFGKNVAKTLNIIRRSAPWLLSAFAIANAGPDAMKALNKISNSKEKASYDDLKAIGHGISAVLSAVRAGRINYNSSKKVRTDKVNQAARDYEGVYKKSERRNLNKTNNKKIEEKPKELPKEEPKLEQLLTVEESLTPPSILVPPASESVEIVKFPEFPEFASKANYIAELRKRTSFNIPEESAPKITPKKSSSKSKFKKTDVKQDEVDMRTQIGRRTAVLRTDGKNGLLRTYNKLLEKGQTDIVAYFDPNKGRLLIAPRGSNQLNGKRIYELDHKVKIYNSRLEKNSKANKPVTLTIKEIIEGNFNLQFRQGGTLENNFINNVLVKFNSGGSIQKFVVGGYVGNVSVTGNTVWSNDIFSKYFDDLYEGLKSGKFTYQDINNMLTRHSNLYKDYDPTKGAYKGIGNNVGQYLQDIIDKYGFVNSKGITNGWNVNRYLPVQNRGYYTDYDLKGLYNADNLYGGQTDDRRILGRKGDFTDSDILNYNNKFKDLNLEMYLDDQSGYYKLRLLSNTSPNGATPTGSDNSSSTPTDNLTDNTTSNDNTSLTNVDDIIQDPVSGKYVHKGTGEELTEEELKKYLETVGGKWPRSILLKVGDTVTGFLNNIDPADAIALGRALWGEDVNNKATKILKLEAVSLNDPRRLSEILHGDYNAKKYSLMLASKILSASAKPISSDAGLQSARLLDAATKAVDAMWKGFERDSDKYWETYKLLNAANNWNALEAVTVGNENRTRISAMYNRRLMLEAARLSHNFLQIWLPFLSGIEQRMRNEDVLRRNAEREAWETNIKYKYLDKIDMIMDRYNKEYKEAKEAWTGNPNDFYTDWAQGRALEYQKELEAVRKEQNLELYNGLVNFYRYIPFLRNKIPVEATNPFIRLSKSGGTLSALDRIAIKTIHEANENLRQANKETNKNIRQDKREHRKAMALVSQLSADLIKRAIGIK